MHFFQKYSRLQIVSRKQRKLTGKIIIVTVFALFILAFSGLVHLNTLFLPVAPLATTKTTFLVKKGASITSIANNLESSALIKSALIFKLVVIRDGLTNQIQAGQFRVSPSQDLLSIINTLLKGKEDLWITIPEGYRNEQVAEVFHEIFGIDKQEFLDLANDKQGYLFPDTYLMSQTVTPQSAIQTMLDNYNKKISNLKSAIEKSSLSEKQIITLASIVERETLSDQEKPTVAGILLKRMNNDWALQTDATLQYITGTEKEWWPVPKVADKELSSPFNTYRNLGLPPQPIASPGIESIQAVANPKSSLYWFYLHDKSGNIHYATDIEGHNANISKFIH